MRRSSLKDGTGKQCPILSVVQLTGTKLIAQAIQHNWPNTLTTYNYMDYIRVYEPGDNVVDRVVNWLEIALNNYKDPADAVRAARTDLVQVSKDPRLAISSVEK